MSRKNSKTVSAYVSIEPEKSSSIIMASTGSVKDKEVDPRRIIGTIHIKKYLAGTKINGKVETWISIIKKLTAPLEEGCVREELTSEELQALQDCKIQTKSYLEEDASVSLKNKVAEETDELKSLKDVASSMKFKFSQFAYETVTHVINLMVRELLVFTCDNCAAQKSKLTKVSHIPWSELQSKLLSGLYMNTKTVFAAVHPVVEQSSETAPVKPVEVVEAEVDATDEESVDGVEEVKTSKPRLTQYISTTFKEIVSRDERFKGLLLGKEVISVVNDIIYQTLDRYANVIKSLLETANSKTVNERLALIATKILLQDHIHSVDEDVVVVLDVIQSRLDELKALPVEELDDTPEAVSSPKAKKPVKKN